MRILLLILLLSISFGRPLFSIGYANNQSMKIDGFVSEFYDEKQEMIDSFVFGLYFLNSFGKNKNIDISVEFVNEVNDDNNVENLKIEGSSMIELNMIYRKSINSNLDIFIKLGLADINKLHLLERHYGNFEIAQNFEAKNGYSYGIGILINDKIYLSLIYKLP